MPGPNPSDFPDLSRLPKTAVPKRYELKLDVDLGAKVYKGLVNIRLYFHAKETSIVWLHSVGLEISEANIWFSQFGLPVAAAEIIERPADSCIGIRLADPVPEGERGWITIRFSGKISDGLQGFYSLPYHDANGDRQVGAATMFAATEARTCFPCLDEPDFKAVFAVEVTVDSHLRVIGNMPVMDSVFSRGRQRRTDHFEWTKQMSTYLVCIVIGEFDYLETKAGGKTSVRVYTPWGQREQVNGMTSFTEVWSHTEYIFSIIQGTIRAAGG